MESLAILQDNDNTELLAVQYYSWAISRLRIAVTADASMTTYSKEHWHEFHQIVRNVSQHVNTNSG
jgi:hypothetical protein